MTVFTFFNLFNNVRLRCGQMKSGRCHMFTHVYVLFSILSILRGKKPLSLNNIIYEFDVLKSASSLRYFYNTCKNLIMKHFFKTTNSKVSKFQNN